MATCSGVRVTEPRLDPLILCDDCCVSKEAAVIVENAVLARGTVVWYDGTDQKWKPLPAVVPAVLPVPFQLGILNNAVDTTVCIPPVTGLGVITTHNARYVLASVAWPTAITPADKQRVKDLLWANGMKPVNNIA